MAESEEKLKRLCMKVKEDDHFQFTLIHGPDTPGSYAALFFIASDLKRWEYQTTWPASWETCIQVRKQQLELDMEQQTGSK